MLAHLLPIDAGRSLSCACIRCGLVNSSTSASDQPATAVAVAVSFIHGAEANAAGGPRQRRAAGRRQCSERSDDTDRADPSNAEPWAPQTQMTFTDGIPLKPNAGFSASARPHRGNLSTQVASGLSTQLTKCRRRHRQRSGACAGTVRLERECSASASIRSARSCMLFKEANDHHTKMCQIAGSLGAWHR